MPEQCKQTLNTDHSHLTSDVPIKSHHEDRLNRASFAHHIAEMLKCRSASDSLVVGIYGKWGSGKTSVLEMMKEKLQESDEIIIINFNPWYFQSDEQLIRGFFATLGNSLEKGFFAKISPFLTRFATLLSPLSCSFQLGLPFLANAQVGIDGEKLSNVSKILLEKSLEDEKKTIEEILLSLKKHIIILVDDIDRLDKSETHTLFKLVKLLANFPYMTYVLAFDEEIVAAAIGERYGQGKEAGHDFIEKIVQAPLQLPAADILMLQDFLYDGINKILTDENINLGNEDIQKLNYHLSGSFMQGLKSVRMINRYFNNIKFSLSLLKEEVNIADLIILEGVRTIFPSVHSKIYTALYQIFNKYHFLNENEKVKNREHFQRELLSDITDSDKKMLNEVLSHLVPILFNSNFFGQENSDLRDKRLCTKSYFSRYFQYAIPKDDLSEVVFKKYITELTDTDFTVQKRCLDEVIENKTIIQVMRYLTIYAEEFSQNESEQLLKIIPLRAEVIPRETEFLKVSTFTNAISLIFRLLEKVDLIDKRLTLLEEIISNTDYVPCSLALVDYIARKKSEYDDVRWLSDEELDAHKKVLIERIKVEDAKNPIYIKFPEDAISMYSTWRHYEGVEIVKNVLTKRFDKHPNEIYSFIKIFCDRLVSEYTPCPLILDDSTYQVITSFLDGAYVFSLLRQQYGAELDNPQNEGFPENWPQEKRIGHQFAYWHKYTAPHSLQIKNKGIG